MKEDSVWDGQLLQGGFSAMLL